MSELTNEYITLLCVGVFCIAFTILITLSRSKNNITSFWVSVLISFIFGIFLKFGYEVDTYKMFDIDDPYAQCGSPNRMLEITPTKQCDLGPYTWGSPDSARYKFCSKQTPSELSEVMCTNPAFHGRPVHFEYSPESDECWKNGRRCDTINYKNNPRVL
jgi:hypothetical protein